MKESIIYTFIFVLFFIIYYYPEFLQLIHSLPNVIQKIKNDVKIIIKLIKTAK